VKHFVFWLSQLVILIATSLPQGQFYPGNTGFLRDADILVAFEKNENVSRETFLFFN
jgi:hypothetical protein